MKGECICITIIIRTNAENVLDKIPTAVIGQHIHFALASAMDASPAVNQLAGLVVEMNLDMLEGVAHVGTA